MCSTGAELPSLSRKVRACIAGGCHPFCPIFRKTYPDFTSVENSQLTKADKRLWKRIWWCLFTRDRSVAVALGRPCCINTEDSDVEMVSEEDFIDDEIDRPADYPADPVHTQFFLNYVKLTEIMGLVLSQQYSAACKNRKADAFDLTASDMALADWLQNCPKEVHWEKSKHSYWAALLQMNY